MVVKYTIVAQIIANRPKHIVPHIQKAFGGQIHVNRILKQVYTVNIITIGAIRAKKQNMWIEQ